MTTNTQILKINNMNNEQFYCWFAGIADGEGSFIINRVWHNVKRYKTVCVSYYPKFHITLRDDDRQILLTLQERLGIGYVTARMLRDKGYKSFAKNGQNQTLFQVLRKEECQKLVDIFKQYPLQTKKSRDFSTWSLIVAEKMKENPDRLYMQYLFEKLKHDRKYGNKEFKTFTPDFIPFDIDRNLIIKDHRYGLHPGSRAWQKREEEKKHGTNDTV